MDRFVQSLALGSLVALASGCRLPTPFSAAQLSEMDGRYSRAAVHYLSQPGADGAVCDLHREGPTLPRADPAVLRAIRKAAVEDPIPPEVAAECWAALLRTLPSQEVDGLLADLLQTSIEQLGEDPAPAVLGPLVRTLLERPVEMRLPTGLAVDVSRRLGELSSPLAAELLADVELEAGRFHGEPITQQRLMGMSEADLLRLARRLPDETLRYQAQALLVSLRIERSRWAFVREHASEVLAATMERHQFAIPPTQTVLSARWEPREDAVRIVRIQADPPSSTARLVGARSDREVAAEPILDLSQGLRVAVEGMEEGRLGPCPSADPWDPTPCVGEAHLYLDDRFASMDGLRIGLATDLSLDDVVLLARSGDRFAPPLRVGGLAVEGFDFRLHFDPVPPIRYGGGTDLLVDIYQISNGRLIVGVQPVGSEERQSAVVPATDAGFEVISQGAMGSQGTTGSAGSTGSTGYAGSMGSCYSPGGTGGMGGPGGPGGTGGPGGAGGDGGDILVTLHCDDCAPLRAFALRQIRSVGGAGGQGGRGGPGGAGGAGGTGGSGGSCSEYDSTTGTYKTRTTSAGSPGSSGSQGASGSSGQAGPPGSPGEVILRTAP